MIGHACTGCGASLADCDIHIRDTGTGCCDTCFTRDTHGLLDDQPAPTDLGQSVDNLTRLAAQAVIARHEHANAIRKLRAEVTQLTADVAEIRGMVAHVTPEERHHVLYSLMVEVRGVVHDLPERIDEVEACVAALEKHLKLRRRPADQRPV